MPTAIRPEFTLTAVLTGGPRRPPDEPTDPGAHRPPPYPGWGWFLLAASVVGALLFAAIHSRVFPN